MEWGDISEYLKMPLSPDAVNPPPEGKFGDYVSALHVIREANRIFGFGGWQYDVDLIKMTNATEKNGMHHVGYMATVRANVLGVQRCDVGHGQGHSRSEGDAHDNAVKEAVTDALKRALRTFGNTFGLALYEKDASMREVGFVASDSEIDSTISAIEECRTPNDLRSFWITLYRTSKHIADNKKVIKAKDRRKSILDDEQREKETDE